MTIGKKIRQARIYFGFTQKSFAKALMITRSYISSVESDCCTPSTQLIAHIALKLNIQLEYFLNENEDDIEKFLGPSENDFKLALDSLDEDSLKIILELVNTLSKKKIQEE